MTLNDVWFILFVFIIAGYLILDGFDMGVGILHLPLARTDTERRTLLNSIGPVWDGNEVWLVLGGGVLFAVFFVEVAIIAGWWTAEIGRQPWVVYNVLLTSDGVSPLLSAGEVIASLGMFVVLYLLLGALFLFLMNRKIQEGPEELEAVETVAMTDLPDTFREVFSRRGRADPGEQL